MLSELFNLEKISGVCEKVCYFFVMNLLFLISNIPVLLFFLFIGISNVRIYLPLFLVCMIPMAPALTAVFYGMNKLLQGIEKNAVHDFWSGYRSGFVQKLKLSAGQLLLLFIFWTNIEFFTKQFFVLPAVILFILLFAFTILITPYLYLLASRYEMTTKAMITSACILTVTRPIGTLGNVAAMGILLMAVELSAGTTVLFAASVYGFLVVFLNRTILKKLEEEN